MWQLNRSSVKTVQKSVPKPAESSVHGSGSGATKASDTPLEVFELARVRPETYDTPRRMPPPEGHSPGQPLPVHPVLQLQGLIGNQAVGRLLGASRIQAKLRINQPGDIYEREADHVADAVARGQTATATLRAGPFIQRDDAPSPSSEQQQLAEPPKESGRLTLEDAARTAAQKPPPSASDEMKKAAEKTAEALRKTKIGKELEEKATELGKDFVSTLEGKIITGTAVAGVLTGLVAADAPLPVQPPEIPLDWLATGLKGKLSWEGPVRHPTKVFLTLTFTPGAEEKKKPRQTEAEKYRAETARIAADMERFRRHMTYTAGSPEDLAQKAEDAAFQRWATSRLGLLPAPAGDALQSAPRLGSFAEDAWKETWNHYFREKRHPRLLGGELQFQQPAPLPPFTPSTGGSSLPPVQRKESSPAASSALTPSVVDVALRTPGQPLDVGTRRSMETHFGHDFSRVKVHTDAIAAESADAIHAHAYTVGRDIVFAAGQYAPRTSSGARLLAHELTHVVQQEQMPAPLVQRQKAAPVSTRDEIIAAFRAEVKTKDWKAAARHLNGLDDNDIARQVSAVNHDARTELYAGALEGMPGFSMRVTEAIAQIDQEAVRVGRLIFDYDTAVGMGNWPRAAEVLNAFNDVDIQTRLNQLSTEHLEAIKAAAQGRFDRIAGPAAAIGRSRALAESLDQIRHIRGSTSVQDAVKKIQDALQGVNLLDRHNLTAVINVISATFGADSGPILEAFLTQVEASMAPREPTQADIAREQRVESLMQIGPRGPYKQYAPGVVLQVLTQPARHLLPAVEAAGHAFAGAAAFVEGLLAGLAGALDEEHRQRLATRLKQSAVLTTIFPALFLAGTVVGVVEDVVDAVKGIYHLFTNFRQFVDAIVTFTRAMLSPDSAEIGGAMGREIGKDYGAKIARMADENIFRFTYDLGRMIGPTILYIVLSFLGVPELIAAEIVERLLPILRPLLEKFPRLLKLMEGLAAKLKERKAATIIGKTLEKRAAEKAAASALETLLKRIPAELASGNFKWLSFEAALAENLATEGMGLADVMAALSSGDTEVRRLFRIAYNGLNNKKIWESVLADVAREAEGGAAAGGFSHPSITSKYSQAIYNISRQRATSQIRALPHDISTKEFFSEKGAFGRRFIDPGMAGEHGVMAHMTQDLVVDQALRQAGESVDAEALRRMIGGVKGTYRGVELRELLWNALYDANESQGRMNAPEKVSELLRAVFGKVD